MSSAAPARSLALPIALVISCAVCGAMLAMGLRQSFGLFLAPMTAEHGWAARDFAFAIGLQVLINGMSQPFMGQLADRFGGRRVVMGGAVLYCIGILGMALSESVVPFTFFAGFDYTITHNINVIELLMLPDKYRRFFDLYGMEYGFKPGLLVRC